MTDDEFVAESQARSLKKLEVMLNERDFYNICDVRRYLENVTGSSSFSWRNDEYERLSLYHCENWNTMPLELREEIVTRTMNFVSAAIEEDKIKKKSWWRKLLP